MGVSSGGHIFGRACFGGGEGVEILALYYESDC